jgi:threonine aldolase
LHADHENAQFLAKGIARIPGLYVDPAKVRSNIVIFDCSKSGKTAIEISRGLQQRGILALDTEPFLVRFVTHCDVDRAAIERALRVLGEIVRQPQTAGM